MVKNADMGVEKASICGKMAFFWETTTQNRPKMVVVILDFRRTFPDNSKSSKSTVSTFGPPIISVFLG